MSVTSRLILYDGVCGLCNRLNLFVLPRDPEGRFHFASLQSKLAAEILHRNGKDPADLDTLYLVLDPGTPGERLLARSDAAFAILRELASPWRALGILRHVPRPIRDWGYGVVARNRYRTFGKHESCPLPEPRYRDRFLEV